MTRLATLGLALGLFAAAPQSLAQRPGDFTRPLPPASPGQLAFFSGANFQGQVFHVNGARPDLRLPYRVRSYAISPGDRWQVCANANFRSPCSEVDQSRPDRGLTALIDIRSARPTRSSAGEFPNAGYAGPSLRGMASEFFRAPEAGGQRILACRSGPETAACAADTAGRFCQARGYAGSAFQRLETVRRQTFLADVLCSTAGV
jgi:hypothetical protein